MPSIDLGEGLSMVTNPNSNYFSTSELPDAVKPHVYPAPYERNDRYIILRDEADASTRDSELEPLSGQLLYADLDFEYNYYAEHYERDMQNKLQYIDRGENYLPDLNLWLLHYMQDADGDGELNYTIPGSHATGYQAIFTTFSENDVYVDSSLSKEYFNNYPKTFENYANLYG